MEDGFGWGVPGRSQVHTAWLRVMQGNLKRVEDMHKEHRHAMQGVKPPVMPPARILIATQVSFKSASKEVPTA